MAAPERVLIIDSDQDLRESSERFLSKEGFEVFAVSDGARALKLIDKWVFDLIILDPFIPDDGLETLRRIKTADKEVVIVVTSAHGTFASATEVMKQGAKLILSKPYTTAELCKVVNQALEKRRVALENLYLRQELENQRHRTKAVYKSQEMAQVFEILERVAPTDSTVLLTGESGTGKSLIASRIHELSGRSSRPFVNVDCGTLVETLFESELFGHLKGAFTGADSETVGKFELAHTGTIFFDEISNISLDVQAKLLKAVDDREISKVGSHRTITVDVRILAATNQDMEKAITQGQFREDLYYRLNVVSIHVPPLRERREDVVPLIEHFLQVYNQRRNMNVEGVSDEAMKILLEHDWPGNVRELSNLIERLVVLGREGIVRHDDLAFVGWRKGARSDSMAESLSLLEMEKEHIRKVLALFNGRKSDTASALGIDRKTLREKIKKYNLD